MESLYFAAVLTLLDIHDARFGFMNYGKSNEADTEIEQYLDSKIVNLKAILDDF